MPTLLQHLERALRRPLLHGPVIVAVSGGPDSVALLHTLHQLKPKKIEIHVAHYNHRLRGDASDADAEYVKQLCLELSVPFHLGIAESGELMPGQSHLESQARKLRYEWFMQLAQELNSGWILTAHTMNDQAETVLHHLVRGTGWRGLRGIAPIRLLMRNERSIRIFRPLLSCTRQAVEAYINQHKLTPCHDASNSDLHFTRNRIRHQVMPKLLEVNTHAVQHLAEWATTGQQHYEQLKATAKMFFPSLITHRTRLGFALKRATLPTITNDFLQELLRYAWRKLHWPVDQMNARRWKETIEVCRGTRTAVELPGKIMVKRKDLVIQFIKQ